MLLSRCSIWCIFFLCLAACDLETSEFVSGELTCSEGLSDCRMRDVSCLLPPPSQDEDTLQVQNLTVYFKLCCENTALCTLCMGIDIEVNINLEKDTLDEDHSGQQEEDYNEEARTPKGEFVTTCYYAVNSMPVCKRVEFAINPITDPQQQHAKISLVITRPSGISFGSLVIVYLNKASQFRQEITAPALEEVCSETLAEHVQECQVPRLSSIINKQMNRVELRPVERDDNHLSMCVQYERNGSCQKWNEMSIPLYSVTPCMCFQAWRENDQRSTRSKSCPFETSDLQIQKNVWHNISVSLAKGQINNYGTMLWWNLSAPCRLSGEVWLCHGQGIKQQLSNGTWRQNKEGLWERPGVFEDIDTQLPPCVMVQVEGMERELGPYYLNNSNRQRWILLLVCLMLLACLTVLVFYLLQGSMKKWAWSCRHGGFVKIEGKSHVVLVSPPDVDEGVSELVSQLGSLLGSHGFSVCVDQWNREKQCIMGPVPWLHSQLLEMKQRGGRVVLVLTRKALETAEEWTRQEAARTNAGDGGVPQTESPYSAVFVACLRLIHGVKHAGEARELFVLVRFDSKERDRSLPELFQGLPLFHLPSQTQALLTGLTVSGSRRRLWTKRRRGSSDEFRAKNAEEEKLQSVLLS